MALLCCSCYDACSNGSASASVRGVLLRRCWLRHRDGAGVGRCPRPGHLQISAPHGKNVSRACSATRRPGPPQAAEGVAQGVGGSENLTSEEKWQGLRLSTAASYFCFYFCFPCCESLRTQSGRGFGRVFINSSSSSPLTSTTSVLITRSTSVM
jgi:hypothetical protein